MKFTMLDIHLHQSCHSLGFWTPFPIKRRGSPDIKCIRIPDIRKLYDRKASKCEFCYFGNDEPFMTSETGDRQLGYFVTRHPNRRGHLIFYIIPATCCVKWVKWQLNSQRCVERVSRHLLEQSDVNFKINVLAYVSMMKTHYQTFHQTHLKTHVNYIIFNIQYRNIRYWYFELISKKLFIKYTIFK